MKKVLVVLTSVLVVVFAVVGAGIVTVLIKNKKN